MKTTNGDKLILVVDDFKDIREAYSHFLRRAGFRVAVAADGQEALDKAFALRPNLVLMDLSLPVINGWTAAQELRKDKRTASIPIIILTAYSAEGLESVIKEGCDGFLMKQAPPEDLLGEIQRVLNNASHPPE